MNKGTKKLIALKAQVREKYEVHSTLTKEQERRTSEIEYEKRAAISKIHQEYENKKNEVVKTVQNKKTEINLADSQAELRDYQSKIQLKCALASLGEPAKPVWQYSKKEMNLETVDTETANLVIYIQKNNKPKNCYDLVVYPELKTLRLQEFYLKEARFYYGSEIYNKSFPCPMEAFAYFTKNRDKIIAPFLKAEKNLITEAAKIDFNPLEDFDCSLVDTELSGRSIIETGVDYFIVKDTKWIGREMFELIVKVIRNTDGTFYIDGVAEKDMQQAIVVATDCIKYNKPFFIDNPIVAAKERV
jgi:hypothetical protein